VFSPLAIRFRRYLHGALRAERGVSKTIRQASGDLLAIFGCPSHAEGSVTLLTTNERQTHHDRPSKRRGDQAEFCRGRNQPRSVSASAGQGRIGSRFARPRTWLATILFVARQRETLADKRRASARRQDVAEFAAAGMCRHKSSNDPNVPTDFLSPSRLFAGGSVAAVTGEVVFLASTIFSQLSTAA
jgi:hypothetical protein